MSHAKLDESQKSVGVITFFNYCNYGAALQCYGLYETLRRMGHKVEYIDYTCPFIGNPFGLDSLRKRGLIRYVYTVAGNLFYRPRRRLFKTFRELIPHTEGIGPSDLPSYANNYDRYITGSDQVWNVKLTDFDKSYFLDFVAESKKKLSYAASFGGDNIDETRRDEYATLLGDFEAMSVREDYGKRIVQELVAREPAITLDPTLLLRHEDWNALASDPVDKKPYIFVYQMGFSNTLIRAARKLKKKTGLKLHYVPFPLGVPVAGRYHLRLGPKEWLALIRDARYIVTDSYHGVVFALLFEKKFAVVAGGQHKNKRVISLLTRLGLQDRIIDDELIDIDANIDYEHVKELLEADRQDSIAWLKNNV
ncbi:MAG: polysaccharide pyruvyl transferase family protein [Atopobiaceae bacterium]|nr:polysaccharide pyruvyl transferase family protein [Atopobiaceae bacterium]